MNRFSYPLSSERVNHSFIAQAIEEQREANKKEIIFMFIENFYASHQEMPTLDLIQDIYCDLDLDDDMINHYLKEF
jgi:ribonuclease BN (tRNA processing enzyme)